MISEQSEGDWSLSEDNSSDEDYEDVQPEDATKELPDIQSTHIQLSLQQLAGNLLRCASNIEGNLASGLPDTLEKELGNISLDLTGDAIKEAVSTTTADVDANIIGISHRGCSWRKCSLFSNQVELSISSTAGLLGGTKLKGELFLHPYTDDPKGATVKLSKLPRAKLGLLALGSFHYDVMIYGDESKLNDWSSLAATVRNAILKVSIELGSFSNNQDKDIQACSGVLNSLLRSFNSKPTQQQEELFTFKNQAVIAKFLDLTQRYVNNECPQAHLILSSLGCKAHGNSAALNPHDSPVASFRQILEDSLNVSAICMHSTFWLCDFGIEKTCWTKDGQPTVLAFTADACRQLNQECGPSSSGIPRVHSSIQRAFPTIGSIQTGR
jgi:hypothetical protein